MRQGPIGFDELNRLGEPHGIRFFDDWIPDLKAAYNLRLIGEQLFMHGPEREGAVPGQPRRESMGVFADHFKAFAGLKIYRRILSEVRRKRSTGAEFPDPGGVEEHLKRHR